MKLSEFDIWLTNFLLSIGLWGYVLSCILILFESIIPILPLSVFITLLFFKFGPLVGFLISYFFTVLGCLMSYKIFSSGIKNKFDNYIIRKDKKQLRRIMKNIKKIKFENLCLIIAIPFTPAYLVNIAAGLSGISKRKYIFALLVGKVFLVIFWGFVGTSLINSFKDPLNLIFIIILLILCFVISKLVNKREGIE